MTADSNILQEGGQILLPEGLRPSNLLELEQDSAEGNKFGYAVMESCRDGVERVIFRVTKKGLDGRVLTKLRRLMAVDLQTRIAIAERDREKFEAEQAAAASEELWERMGGPMWVELEKNGFIDGRGVSYRKLNRAARRHMQHKGRRSIMDVQRHYPSHSPLGQGTAVV
jgi:hypothetical protein